MICNKSIAKEKKAFYELLFKYKYIFVWHAQSDVGWQKLIWRRKELNNNNNNNTYQLANVFSPSSISLSEDSPLHCLVDSDRRVSTSLCVAASKSSGYLANPLSFPDGFLIRLVEITSPRNLNCHHVIK